MHSPQVGPASEELHGLRFISAHEESGMISQSTTQEPSSSFHPGRQAPQVLEMLV
jgi:hypothetical protein